MSDLKKNLRLIIGIDELVDRIKELENRAPIGAREGRATQDAALGNETAPGTVGANGGVNRGPTSSLADATTNSAAGVIDSNLSPGDKLDFLNDIHDCESGKDMTIGETGEYIPPENWETADTPSTPSAWEQGYYYVVSGTYFTETTTPDPGQAPFLSIGYVHPSLGYKATDVRSVEFSFDGGGNIIGGDYEVYLDWSDTATPSNTGWVGASFFADKQTCAELGTSACPVNQPSHGIWPEKNEFQLSRNGGKLKPSAQDPNVPAEYQNGQQSSVDFCFGVDRTGRQEETVAGGFMIYETDISGDPMGEVKIFDSNAEYITAAPAEDIGQYRPNP